MILKLLFELVIGLLEIVFGWVSFPPLPHEIMVGFSNVLGYIRGGMGFVWLIVPRDLVLVVLPIVLIIENFDRLYSVVMWILKKIPFLGMK